MDDFNYMAPQFIDLSSPTATQLTDYGEDYFDVEHEPEIGFSEVIIKNDTIVTVTDTEELQSTPINGEVSSLDGPTFHEFRQEALNDSASSPEIYGTPVKLRRSLSVGAVQQIRDDVDQAMSCAMENLALSARKTHRVFSQSILEQVAKTQSPAPKPTLQPQQRARSVSREALLGANLKRKALQEDTQPRKYISLAEAVRKFQSGTPQRFHSKARHEPSSAGGRPQRLLTTKPQSPMLATKGRSRPVSYVSHAEQEQQAADEMKRYQMKAHPVNKNAMRTPVLNAKVDKKPITKPQPFRFSEVKYKPVAVPREVPYQFHARPAPKTTSVPSQPPVPLKAKPKLPTLSEDTCMSRKMTVKPLEVTQQGVRKETPQKLLRTKIEPFSFEERDKQRLQKKEEKIKKLLDDEKKAREFHARPISSAVTKASQIESKVVKMITEGVPAVKNNENAEPGATKLFKARPASVIYKKPFQPRHDERPLLEVTEFTLNTERRAHEREGFEKKLKEKQEGLDRCKKEFKEAMKRAELEEVARLRREAVHKANPIRHFKDVKIVPSTKEITSPHSPNFTQRKHRKAESE